MASPVQQLAALIRDRRTQAGMSAAELSRRAGVTTSTITRLEAGRIPAPRPDTLKALAGALDIPASDLLASVDYLNEGDMPSFQPYLRSRYGHLSDTAQAEITAAFHDIAARYGYDTDSHGPKPGEDET